MLGRPEPLALRSSEFPSSRQGCLSRALSHQKRITTTPPTSPLIGLVGVPVLAPKGLNTSIYLDINRFARQTAWAHGFMHAYALWLGLVLLAALFVVTYGVCWWARAVRATAFLVLGGIGTIVALGLNQVVGHAAQELRPYATHPQVLVLVGKTNDYAFPSDHAVVAGALVTSILSALILARRSRPDSAPTGAPSRPAAASAVVIAAVAVVLALFLCFARIYVGAHYPGDVVAGLLLGAVVVGAVSLLRPVANWIAERLVPTPVGALLARTPLGVDSSRLSAIETRERTPAG
jgi:membrane-associated phospholipid phosphatase